MARPSKTGLDYFPLDVDFFDDEKIEAISGEFGIKGQLATIKLLCAIYRQGYFVKWNELAKMKLLNSLPSVSLELLETIVSRLVKWEFFDESLFNKHSILTNIDIQKQWIKKSMFIEFDSLNREYLLIEESTIPFYKKNKKARLYKRNVKLWHRIIKEVFKRDNYTCQYCGEVGGKLEADHIIPFSKGGSDDIINLLTSCRKCNRQKKDKPYEEFIKSKRTNNNEKK